MKHFNFKTLAMGAALAGSLFTTNVVQAQSEYTDPNKMTVGYYHVVSVDNPEYAWTVLPTKEMAVAKLDRSKPEFVWFLTGRNGKGIEDEIGTKIVNQGSAYRLRFRFGNPAWTAGDTFYAMGGLDANADKQLLTIDKEWGMHNWRDVNATGFRFSASNRSYDVAPLNKTWNNGAKLWYYNNAGNAGRWKLEPVSEEVLTALKAIEDVETFIKGLPTYEKEQAIAASGILAVVAQLIEMKDNVGTEQGQYNFTPDANDADVWNNLDSYADSSSEVYKDSDLNTLLAQMNALVDKVKATLVAYDLGLADVNIVTLQWNGTGRYAGINGGTGWDNQSGTFGNPNGGNGRIGIITKGDGTFAIATQGVYMTISETGAKGNANTLDGATSFTVTRSSENGLTFKAANGYYLVNQNFDTSKDAPTTDYKVNSYDVENSYSLKASQDLVKVNDNLYMAAIRLPFKVQKPEGEGFHTYIIKLVDGEIVTEEVDVVEAGVPFIYVSPTNDDNKRLLIPQENQAYVSLQEATAQSIMMGWYLKEDNGVGDEHKNYYYAVRNGVFGFYTDATPADVNQAAISGTAVQGTENLKYFEWDAQNNELKAITETFEVTYQVSYNGEILKSETVTVAKGDAPAIPSSFNAAFTTLTMVDAPATITENVTITVQAEWNPPFEVSTSVADAHWYNLDIRDGHWVRVQDTEPYQPIVKGDVTNNDLLSDAYQWAFMGTPYELYVYNKSTGEMTWKDDNGNVVMRDGTFSWELVKNDDTNPAVFVLREDGTNKYVNQAKGGGNNRNLTIWNSTAGYNDDGCEFIAYEVPSLYELAINNGWASLYLDYNAVVPENVNAYYVSAVGDGYASLTQIEGAIPANTAVLLEATTAGSYTFEYTATATALEGANMLKGTTVNTYIEGPAYVLANKNGTIGLYKATLNKDENGDEDETHFLNNANKAYLPAPAGSAAPMLRITRGEDTTGIENSEITIQNSTVIYDLLGRRVEKMEKGIYIVNGKKVVK